MTWKQVPLRYCMRQGFRWKASLVLGLLFWCSFTVWAAQEPIVIHSDRMEVLQDQQVVVFTGHVVARKRDFTLYADRLVVYYQKGKEGKQEVLKMVATGHVKIKEGAWLAQAGKAVYLKNDDKIVLTDKPTVWQGDNVVRGAKITLYLKDRRSVVEGAPEKEAEAVIFTD